MNVSVVIVAKHAEKTIRYTIESLLKQTVKPYEIIVVVDSLTDPTVEAVKGLPVRLVLNEGVGLGAARRTGVNASRGSIVAFIDADCIADEKWVESLVRRFSDDNVMVQAGSVIAVKSLSEISTRANTPVNRDVGFLKVADTLNFAFRKKSLSIL